MKEIGLYFGSFNPIHVGHLIVANFMAQEVNLDEVWFVVSPQNPFKSAEELLPDNHRLQMVRLAIREHELMKTCDVEFNLPRPSFTINTLNYLKNSHPEVRFSLIMGEDNLRHLHRWKESEAIVSNHRILVYARSEQANEAQKLNIEELDPLMQNRDIHVFHAPMLWISSSYIRDSIRGKRDIRYLVPESVVNYISNNFLYEKKP